MLDYKSIIIKRYALGLSYKELAEEFSASKSGINDFIRAFERCEKLSYPLPEGITNYAIYELVYGHEPGTNRRNDSYVYISDKLTILHGQSDHLSRRFRSLISERYSR